MSTSIDTRRRPNLWSYISFGSAAPRHRASSIPTRSDADPYEKPNRHSHGRTGSTSFGGETYTGGLMAQSPRGRFIRAFGLVAFIACIFLWLAPKERAKVEDFVGGTLPIGRPRGAAADEQWQNMAIIRSKRPHRVRGRVQSPTQPISLFISTP